MSDADYPAIGFDPLPGNPEAVRALAAAARLFADRMTEQAHVLNEVRHGANWRGEAAEAFAAGLEHLPGRLQAAGRSVHVLADHLDEYCDRFGRAKLGTWALEERARAARAALTTAQMVNDQPVMTSPDVPWCPPDRTAIDRASEDLGAILREAHRYGEEFEDSVADLATSIQRLAETAPEAPQRDLLGWATKVFELTPMGRAVELAHHLINENPHLFAEFAELLEGVSAVAALLAVPCMVVPTLGAGLGVVALATASGAALVNTSLYAGHTTDENGRPYVTGGKLAVAWGNVGVVAAGMGIAGAASGAARGTEATLGKEISHQFARETFKEAGKDLGKIGELRAELGAKGAGKWMRRIAAKEWTSMSDSQRFLNAFGIMVATEGPDVVSGDSPNPFGLKDITKIQKVMALPRAALEDLEPEPPDLHLDSPPTIRPAHRPPEIRPSDPSPKPVMDG